MHGREPSTISTENHPTQRNHDAMDIMLLNRKTSEAETETPTKAVARKAVASVWLNIGYEANGRFVNLPLGLPIDTMKPARFREGSRNWIRFCEARNALLAELQAKASELAPGEEVIVRHLVLRLRRVKQHAQDPQSKLCGIREQEIAVGSVDPALC